MSKALKYQLQMRCWESHHSLHQTMPLMTLPAPQTKLQQTREETTKDPILNTLTQTIYRGWPDKQEKCPEALHDYWNFREELTVEDGLILKGDCIVVPPTLRKEFLSIIHQGHLGQKKCLLRVRTSVFSPGLSKDVTNLVKECDPCQWHQRKHQTTLGEVWILTCSNSKVSSIY